MGKPLRCKKCNYLIGQVRVKPVFRRKLVWYALWIALGLELIANSVVYLLMKLIGL